MATVDKWARAAAQTEEQEEQVAKVEATEAMVDKVVTAVVTAELVATAEMEAAWVVATAERREETARRSTQPPFPTDAQHSTPHG